MSVPGFNKRSLQPDPSRVGIFQKAVDKNPVCGELMIYAFALSLIAAGGAALLVALAWNLRGGYRGGGVSLDKPRITQGHALNIRPFRAHDHRKKF